MQFCMFEQIPRPRVVPVGRDENLQNGFRLVAQFGNDGVKAVDEAGLGHGLFRYFNQIGVYSTLASLTSRT